MELDKPISRLEVGTYIDAVPDFIAPANNRCSRSPVFYLGKSFDGYLRELNSLDISRTRKYEMIVRGIGGINQRGKRIVFLEERVKEGDKIHVKVVEEHDSGKNILIVRFLRNQGYKDYFHGRYFVFVHKQNPEKDVSISVDDFVFGRVTKVKESKQQITLSPISLVSEPRFLKHENRIFRG